MSGITLSRAARVDNAEPDAGPPRRGGKGRGGRPPGMPEPQRLPPARGRRRAIRRLGGAALVLIVGAILLVEGGFPGPGPAIPHPSGIAMPRHDPPGWTAVAKDDFNGTHLGRHWYAYSGQPGGDPGGWWDPSHVTVGGGMLALTTSVDPAACGSCSSYKKYVSGGVGSRISQTYGRYDVRLRLADAHGVSFAALLWPTSGIWPPEIDFMEGAGDRLSNKSSVHYSAANSVTTRAVRADLTQWHTWTVEWSPNRLVYKMDGQVFGTVQGSQVPSEPMEAALQSQTWNCSSSPIWTCPDATTPVTSQVQVDWFVTYKKS